jgi:hypothetical protein
MIPHKVRVVQMEAGESLLDPSFYSKRNNGADIMPDRSFASYSAGVARKRVQQAYRRKPRAGSKLHRPLAVRYFDVAPWYGFGLAERRFGHFLHVFYVAMSVTECARADLDVDRHSVAEFDAADVKQKHERHHDGELCRCHGIGVGRKFPYAK